MQRACEGGLSGQDKVVFIFFIVLAHYYFLLLLLPLPPQLFHSPSSSLFSSSDWMPLTILWLLSHPHSQHSVPCKYATQVILFQFYFYHHPLLPLSLIGTSTLPHSLFLIDSLFTNMIIESFRSDHNNIVLTENVLLNLTSLQQLNLKVSVSPVLYRTHITFG